MNLTDLYSQKSNGYFRNARPEIVELVPAGSNVVLDIGCGQGNMGAAIKEAQRAKYVVGVELFEGAAQQARKVLDDVIVGNIEHIELAYPQGYFDAIICADVFEHLVDPWDTIKKLALHLKKGGYLIASIPNVREIKTLSKILVGGSFEYEEGGVLDKTHLRFFCKKNAIDLVRQADLKIEKISYKLSSKRTILNNLSLGMLKEFIVTQYLIVAVK